MLGSHLSIAGGLHQALIQAANLGMNCVQIFTRNQRQWTSRGLEQPELDQWRIARKNLINQVRQVVAHGSYLVNLAGPAGDNRNRSMAAFRDELIRCELLAIELAVIHPGSHMGRRDDPRDEAAGIARAAAALDAIHRDLPGYRVITCLEITAGQGTNIGCRLEHLRQIADRLHQAHRVAFCMDTAHLLAAGYDLTSLAGSRAVLDEINAVLDARQVRVWHINDSQSPRGSRLDRHQHIGQGHISRAAFTTIINHPAWRDTPQILETPKGQTATGRDFDALNLARLRRMMSRNANV